MTERDRILEEMAVVIRETLGLDHVEWEQWLEVADAALRVIETPPKTEGKTYARCTCGNNGYSEHDMDCAMYPACGKQDVGGDGHVYGTCELPAGHGYWHQEWRDGKLWAEWGA